MAPSSPRHLLALEKRGLIDTEHPLRLTGVLTAQPDRRPDRLMLELAVEEIQRSGRRHPAEGKVRITVRLSSAWQERSLPFRVGDRVQFPTKLRRPDPPGNPGGFNYRLWLSRRGISHVGSVKSPIAVEIISRGGGIPGAAQVSSLRSALGERVRHDFSPAGALSQRGALLQAMLLGQRGEISEETKRLLRRTGLLHIIAISGLHVWLLGLIVFLLLRFMRLPDRLVTLATLTAILAYWALAGGRSSAGRASLVAIIFLLGRLFYRIPNILNNLAFAAFVILLFAPTELYSAGFQFTFAAAISISLIFPVLNELFKPVGRVGQVMAVSLAAVFGTLPLTSTYFNIVTLHGALTTSLLIPAMTLLILLGFVYIVIASLLPFTAGFLAGIVGFLLGITLEAASLFDNVLPAALRLPAPPVWLVAAYYGAYLLITVLAKRTERRITPLLPFAAMLTLVVWNPFAGPQGGKYVLHAIDVGQGESLLLELPDGSAAIIDGGGSPFSDYDIGEYEVCRFLWQRNHRRIELMVSTHSDSDHIEGLLAVGRNFDVGELWITTAAEQNGDLMELLRMAKRRGWKVKRLSRGMKLRWRGTTWNCLNPPQPPYKGKNAANANSLVALVTAGDRRLLLTGDAGAGQLRDIALINGIGLRCDVLKVPHHGSDDALCEELLDASRPSYAVISAGLRNVHGFPRPDVLAELERREITVLRTDLHGAVSLTLNENMVSVRTQKHPAEGNRKAAAESHR